MALDINLQSAPHYIASDTVEVGQLYKNQRGALLLVCGISGDTAYYLRYGPDGKLNGCGQYGAHYLREKAVLGTVDLPDLDPEWI